MTETTAVLDSYLAHREAGSGTPVVLLHGNPNSSYMWRNVIPHLAGQGRILAPDLIGMGESGKPDTGYRFTDHAVYLDAWFEAMGLTRNVVLVGHDWGGALALDHAARHPGRVRGVALIETFLRPGRSADQTPEGRQIFERLRGPEGERMVLEENSFVEFNLPRGVLTGLSKEDHDVYRAPYPTPASRLPTLVWPREIPIDGSPADVTERVEAYGRWAAASPDVPKLLMTVEPGAAVPAATVDWARETYAALEVESVGRAGHNAMEDQPDAIGAAVSRWLERHGLTGPRG
ncbi:Haloalkane dehalogenase [Streptomyces sp. RB5]|uniref:Haloalkane dehalogenase n=1 Tax=Streptomyces smaragdinus TaxID=2585196 RepID=A0A7K0CF47_9ACTN|nr:haloalkane dehalogenase [Streptomyces smaragdinus]MQY11983.1 Haloalkane dehalogenase [Streptomyces smaragdinus]